MGVGDGVGEGVGVGVDKIFANLLSEFLFTEVDKIPVDLGKNKKIPIKTKATKIIKNGKNKKYCLFCASSLGSPDFSDDGNLDLSCIFCFFFQFLGNIMRQYS